MENWDSAGMPERGRRGKESNKKFKLEIFIPRNFSSELRQISHDLIEKFCDLF